jgi:hypothetical protein
MGPVPLKSGTDEYLRGVAFLVVLVPSVEGRRPSEGEVHSGRDTLGVAVLDPFSCEGSIVALVGEERVWRLRPVALFLGRYR